MTNRSKNVQGGGVSRRRGGGVRGQCDKMFIMLLKACQLRVCIAQIQIRKQAAAKVGHDAAGCMLCLSASLSRCPSVCRLSVQIKESEREREGEGDIRAAFSRSRGQVALA